MRKRKTKIPLDLPFTKEKREERGKGKQEPMK